MTDTSDIEKWIKEIAWCHRGVVMFYYMLKISIVSRKTLYVRVYVAIDIEILILFFFSASMYVYVNVYNINDIMNLWESILLSLLGMYCDVLMTFDISWCKVVNLLFIILTSLNFNFIVIVMILIFLRRNLSLLRKWACLN